MPTNRLLLLCLAALVGCAGPREADPPPPFELSGTSWRLLPEPGASVPAPDEPAATALFSDGRRIAGSTGCNRYFGEYEQDSDRLILSRVGSTRMACAPPAMAREADFLGRLERVARWSVAGDTLLLKDEAGAAVLRFQRQDAAPGDVGEMLPQPTGQTHVFECAPPQGEAFSFTLRTGPGEAAVWLPARFGGRYLVLGQARAAGGARYEGDGVTVWNKGDEAVLEVGDAAFPGCTRNPARAAWEDARRLGVDFRAVGQEPGWLLEIDAERSLRFLYDYGAREITAPAPKPVTAGGRTVYRLATAQGALVVEIEPAPCADAMSGEAFEARVTVAVGGAAYAGCGRALGQG